MIKAAVDLRAARRAYHSGTGDLDTIAEKQWHATLSSPFWYRNLQLYKLRVDTGEGYNHIGRAFGMSRTRARNICLQMDDLLAAGRFKLSDALLPPPPPPPVADPVKLFRTRRIREHVGWMIQCERCRKKVQKKRRDARWCSDSCREAAWRARR